MGYEENKFETEAELSADEAKVREMLGGLNRVEAPKNFAFGVQARIANAKPEDFRANSWLTVLRYAAPLALVLIVTGAFVIRGLYSVNDNSVPPVAEIQIPQSLPLVTSAIPPTNEVAVRVPDPTGGSIANSNAASPDANNLAANPRRSPLERRTRDPRDEGVGSRDSTLGAPLPFFQPPGAQSNTLQKPGEMGGRGQIAIRGILEIAGIRADFGNQGWKVRSVDANSVAERSGVKAGDLIEAINGLPVTDGTQFSGIFIGKNVQVKRDGKTVQIDLNLK